MARFQISRILDFGPIRHGLTPFVAHLVLVMLRLTPYVAHLMLVMVLNMPEKCSFQDLLFHLLFMPKYAEKSAGRMGISLSNGFPNVSRIESTV